MRLFAAVVPPPPVLADVARLVDGVRHGWPGLRWSRHDQWHLTLSFYGEVDEDDVPDLERRLARAAARATPAELAFGPGGTFGNRTRARLVWLRADG
ncbi:MAG: RNA 2',3'-cyclic phosphodiesterase, partial [Actinomycetes bacterium]